MNYPGMTAPRRVPTDVHKEPPESEAGKQFVHELTMRLCGDGHGCYCGGMRFETSPSAPLTVNSDKASGGAYKVNVSCGSLLCFVGKWGARLDSLGCVFLAEIASAQIHDVVPQQT